MDIMHLLFSFQGRTRRLHFWVVAIVTAVVVAVFERVVLGMSGWPQAPLNPVLGLLLLPVGIVDLWISLALGVKRCHDRNKSGWFLVLYWLVSLTVIGALWPLIELGFLDGTQGPNRFGPSPKGIGGTEPISVAA
jgi:uncharacterized membrane protein YhaH (DUF805 family)